MKNGRPSWTTRCTGAALSRIHEAIDAGAETPREIFDRFNVGQYGITPRTFRRYCSWRQREWEARQTPRPMPSSWEDLLESLGDTLQVALDASRFKQHKLPEAIKAVLSVARFKIEQETRERAAETVSGALQGSTLTAEQVAEIRSKVLGI